MDIIPAIDVRGGKVVRLVQGDPSRETRYADDPVAVAQEWVDGGASRLHVVDLDAALGASVGQDAVLERIFRGVPVPVQLGGGLRSLDRVRAVLDLGAAVAILGTAAVRDPTFLESACEAFPRRVALGLDAKGGYVAVAGWTETTAITAVAAARAARALPLAAIITTDVARDGMLGGPDLTGLRAVAEASGQRVIASGGVTSAEDIRALRALEASGVVGAIVGKALYDGRLTLEAALAAGRGE